MMSGLFLLSLDYSQYFMHCLYLCTRTEQALTNIGRDRLDTRAVNLVL